MKRARLACLSLVPLGLVVALAAACSAFADLPNQQACHGIPEGGCPGSGRLDCKDPSCAAVYTCEPDGGWAFAVACPAHDASAHDARQPVGRDADIDVPPGAYGGPGCGDLQSPDCNLGVALVCPAGECCGCQDLFVCGDGGWNLWGACEDGGAIVASGAAVPDS